MSRFERGVAELHRTVLLTLAHALDTTASQIPHGLALAPTRPASQAAMQVRITANPGISSRRLATTLLLPEWYMNQNARRMRSLGLIHQRSDGWLAGARGVDDDAVVPGLHCE